MKKLSEMKFSANATLSQIELAIKGGYVKVGSGTGYSGPDNPSSLETYVDGSYEGSDGLSGSLYGDAWSCNFFDAKAMPGDLEIASA